jgi:hypothetical protein
MVLPRLHEAADPVKLEELVRSAGLSYPLFTPLGLRVEKNGRRQCGPNGVVIFKNLPGRTYTVPDDFALDEIIESLAWEAGEWEAIELSRAWRRSQSGKEGGIDE